MTPPSSRARVAAEPATGIRSLASGAAIGGLGVFALVATYFWLYRTYGFQIEDEGTLYFQLARAASGQLPYSDFHTGYTPGFFATFAWLLRTVGFEMAGMRLVLTLLNAATAAGLYVVAARAMGPLLALIPPLAWVAFLPVRPGDFVSFNVPYPAWPATAAWIATALCMTTWARRGGIWPLVIAGMAASFAFANKINAGAFALAGCVWAMCFFAGDRRTTDRIAMITAAVAMLLGLWFSLGFITLTVDAVVHVLPCVAITVIAVTRGRSRLHTPSHPGALPALAGLVAGFLPPMLAWAVPVLSRLGVEGFAREVLLIGSGAAGLYYVPHPLPQTYAVVTTLGALAAAALARLLARGHLPLRYVAAAAAAAIAATLIAATQFAEAPEGFRRSVSWQLENAAFWLAPLASYGAVTLLATRLLRRRARPSERALAAIIPLAAAMYVQLFPRSDFMHLVISVPLILVAATALLARVIDWFEPAGQKPALLPPHLLRGGVTGAVLLVLLIRYGLNLEPLARVVTGRDARQWTMQTPRMNTWVEGSASDDLVAFGKTVDFLSRHAAPGESLLHFPAVAGALYGADARSPIPHDYWYPGRPAHEDERHMLATIEQSPPRYVVTLNDGWTFFIGSPAYFTDAEAFARRSYRLAARFGRFDVLVRNDLRAAHAEVERWTPAGTAAALVEAEVAPRRQAARRWCSWLTPQESAQARLPEKRSEAILFLRALRDGGDMRAAGWLLAGYYSGDER
ncbi:MAG TPA: hypothetical protein VEL28_03725, partial [Candidatus Binatia bacterium]|nr:hypothetical protein [Candidatus Binatia bacterium]